MSQNRLHRALVSVLHSAGSRGDASSILTLGQRMSRVGSGSLPLEIWVAGVLCLTPIALRSLLLVEHSLQLGSADVHGYLSDLTVAALISVVLSAVLRTLKPGAGTWVAIMVTSMWTLIHFGNYEHVKALGAPLQFTYAQYMRDGVFIAGSAFSVSRLGSLIALLTVSIAAMVLAVPRGSVRLAWQTRGIVVLALAFVDIAWPQDHRALAWRERDFMELLLAPSSAKAFSSDRETLLPQKFHPNVEADLNGRSILAATRQGQPNVLLVILEGIAGGSIPSIAAAHGVTQVADMPELSAIAEKNISYPTFIANQRQTNRGEFALLCGHLDYLVSGTSRMTEYARDGGDPCLPRVLAENGYRTMYIQPAPLSFMLKDQFMAKAGFTDLRGHDAFPNAYARSNWGVDDQAFFEQSATMIRDLNAGGAPWFAALLTVGTHHPYTVPSSFRTGTANDDDPHGKAVRYLDRAIGAFVAQLEAENVLDNTLLLITSDESFGVNGYDDLTQLLSYNWGFLIAKVPGEASRVVEKPFAQTDIAVSVTDYLGLASRPFAGRSVFREYENERRIVFANTYQQKVYWAEPPVIVECTEALTECQRHTSRGLGLFSPDRSTAAAEETDVSPLRAIVAATNTHQSHSGAGRTPLVLDNAAVWDMGPDAAALVFGGQYFTLEADQEVVVSLDATLSGRGASVMLDSDLFARAMLYEVFPPPLYEGDRLKFEYIYAPGKTVSNVEVRLNATRLAPATSRLILQNAELTVRARTLAITGGVTTHFEVDRARPQETYYLGSGTALPGSRPMLATNDCVSQRDAREFVASGCRHGMLVFGPYVNVAAGSEVRAVFDVVSETGTAKLRSEVVSGMGKQIYAQTDVVEIRAGAGTSIVARAHVPSGIEGLEARLALVSADDDAQFVIRRAVLEVIPPAVTP
jgi:hypothetical protein